MCLLSSLCVFAFVHFGGQASPSNLGVCLCVHTNVPKHITLSNVCFYCLFFLYLYYRFIHYVLNYDYTPSHVLSLALCAMKSDISSVILYHTFHDAIPESPRQLLTLARALSFFFFWFFRANFGGHFLRGGDGRRGYFQERSLVQALGLFLLLWLFGGLRSEEEGRGNGIRKEAIILDRGLQRGVPGRPLGRGAR